MTWVDDTLYQHLFCVLKAIPRVSDKWIASGSVPMIIEHWPIHHCLWYFHSTKCWGQLSFALLQTKFNHSTQVIQVDCLAINGQLIERLWFPNYPWKRRVITENCNSKPRGLHQSVERRVVAFTNELQQREFSKPTIKIKPLWISVLIRSISSFLRLPFFVTFLSWNFNKNNKTTPICQNGGEMAYIL